MGTNIRLVNDVKDYFDMTDKNGILFMLDFTKAFDSLEWKFLLKTLRFFNFGPSFIKWIETVCHQPVACVKNNGHFSDTFGISRGIRQGCPVSALLFIVCAEILGKRIRSCNTLGGFVFSCPEKPVKVIQYADNGILFLNSKNEMCTALNVLNKFGKVSGL